MVSQTAFQLTLDFLTSKPVVVVPSADQVSSDAGLLPFRQLDERIGPRVITCAENDLVLSVCLLHGTAHAALGAQDDLEYVLRRLREVWPDVQVHLRGDSGFGTPAMGDTAPARGKTALALFDWTQRAADVWRGSNPAIRREILDCVCLNRTLADVSLCLKKRKPFDVFAEGLDLKKSRGDGI